MNNRLKIENMDVYYDEEGDFLEITTGDIINCFFDNLGNGIFGIVDKDTGEINGFAVHSFKARTKSDSIKLKLPFKFKLS